ncbi:hypothetical protein N7528_006939 [Penicillium herquei]|nr:hypothetical protein N7528_006939 [Penicillium herquei]
MSTFLRRTSDFFKHHTGNQRHGSVDSTKSTTSDPNAPSSEAPGVEAPIEAPAANDHATKQRRWSLGRREDEETRDKRKVKQLEKDRAEFAATRRYSQSRRKSSGAGMGFEGGWQG